MSDGDKGDVLRGRTCQSNQVKGWLCVCRSGGDRVGSKYTASGSKRGHACTVRRPEGGGWREKGELMMKEIKRHFP